MSTACVVLQGKVDPAAAYGEEGGAVRMTMLNKAVQSECATAKGLALDNGKRRPFEMN